jgi:hypothetical protein
MGFFREGKEKEEVAFFKKKAPQRKFDNFYTGCFSVPREQKFFAELFYKKATSCLNALH